MFRRHHHPHSLMRMSSSGELMLSLALMTNQSEVSMTNEIKPMPEPPVRRAPDEEKKAAEYLDALVELPEQLNRVTESIGEAGEDKH